VHLSAWGAADDGKALLSAPLEPTNEFYAVAKIAGIKLCQAYRRQYGCRFISAMPTNLYGPNDNFDLASSHVMPALMRKFHDAKLAGQPEVSVWGSGKPRREFLHVDDLADACVFLMRQYDEESHINVGTGEDQHPRLRSSFVTSSILKRASSSIRRNRMERHESYSMWDGSSTWDGLPPSRCARASRLPISGS
jgi:nucleoside-diphosphate-sugar epimerase